MSLFLLYELFFSFFFALSPLPSTVTLPLSVLIPPLFRWLLLARLLLALRLSYTPLPLRLNEQRRAGASTSLLIKWPRESAPGFSNDEILLAAASWQQISSSRRRGAMAKNYEARNVAPHDRTTHGIAIVNAKKLCRYAKFYCNKNYFIIHKNYNFPAHCFTLAS